MPSKQKINAAAELVGDYTPKGEAAQELYALLRLEFLAALACLVLHNRNYATTALGLMLRYALYLEKIGAWDRHSGDPVPFTHRWVTLFTEHRMQQGYLGAQTGQSMLSAIGRVYQPSLWPRPTATARVRNPKEPCDPKEQAQYAALASQYRAATGDARVEAAVSGVFGAGLAVPDLRVVRGHHVTADGTGGALVHVEGSTLLDRVVPVLPEWADMLLAAAAAMGDQLLVSGSDDNTRNLAERITVPLHKFCGLRPSFRRMRATWIIGRLAAGVPERIVREYAGLTDSATFSQFDVHYPGWDETTRHAWVRNGGQPC